LKQEKGELEFGTELVVAQDRLTWLCWAPPRPRPSRSACWRSRLFR
jgi:hypothetical protein